jgi:hypothetical protein
VYFFGKFFKRVIYSPFIDYDSIMSKVDAFFISLISEAQDSLNSFEINFFQINTGEHLLNTATDLAYLIIFSKVVEYDKRLVQGKIKRLTTMLENILHSAIIDDSEDHLASTYFDKLGISF